MNDNIFESIPAQRREHVKAALVATFDSTPVTSLEKVIGGVSALTYRIEMAGRPYLLRLDVSRGLRFDSRRGYECMQIAAEAGIAPPLRHANPDTAIAIMDFVVQRPLAQYRGGVSALARDVGSLIARLQKTPTFPELGEYPVLIERMLNYARGSARFVSGLLDPHAEGLQRIREAYAWDNTTLVSSHNDPNPRNILFDGERLWLVDWETSCRNDPLTDVAIATHEIAATPQLEDVLLQAWLGSVPDDYLRARLFLMQQLTRLYYGCIMLGAIASRPAGQPIQNLTAPTPAEFRLAVEKGELKPGSPETAFILAKICLAGFMTGVSAPRFKEALRISKQG